MASKRIERSTYVEGAWNPSLTGDHTILPLDAALLDDAAIEAAVRAWFSMAAPRAESPAEEYTQRMHAAIAAYAAHVAGGGK